MRESVMSDGPNRLLEEALAQYPFARPAARLIRHNENITYAVEDGPHSYLLRIHRESERLDFSFFRGELDRKTLVESEMELLRLLNATGRLRVQRPVANAAGESVTRLRSGDVASVLTWLEGETLASAVPDPPLAEQLGRLLARLHQAAGKLPPLRRCWYDGAFVDRIRTNLAGACADGHFSGPCYRQMEAICTRLKAVLLRESSRFQLVHGDCGRSNILQGGESLSPIDFSMSGYCLPELDVGDLLCSLGYEAWRAPLLAGYAAECGTQLEESVVALFHAFSVVGYVAIHHRLLWRQEAFQRNLERWSAAIFTPLLAD